MTAAGIVRERDLRVLSAAIGLSALGDGVALVALGLQAKHMSGEGMGGGFAIAAMFICLWAPVVLLSGHVGLLVDRVETRRLLVLVSAGQACVAAALAVAGSLVPLLALAVVLGAGIAVAQAAEFALVPVVAGGRELQRANSARRDRAGARIDLRARLRKRARGARRHRRGDVRRRGVVRDRRAGRAGARGQA